MIRFYAVTSWDVLSRLDYEWVMRFDDDSLLLSAVRYNIFDDMRRTGSLYGYRMYSRECSQSLNDFLGAYVRRHYVPLPFAGDYCASVGEFGYYNNWFVTQIAWWRQPDKVALIRAFDASFLIFTHRDNDLIFQTAAVRLFMSKAQRRRYIDWSYQHHTVVKGRVVFGGIEVGTHDAHQAETFATYLDGNYTRSAENVLFCSVLSSTSNQTRARILVVKHEDAPACPPDALSAL